MAVYGMKQLEERHVPTTVLKMEWSNKMDLLAIAKEHGNSYCIILIRYFSLKSYKINIPISILYIINPILYMNKFKIVLCFKCIK